MLCLSLFPFPSLTFSLPLFPSPLPFTKSFLFPSTIPLSHPSPTLVSFHTLSLYSLDSRSLTFILYAIYPSLLQHNHPAFESTHIHARTYTLVIFTPPRIKQHTCTNTRTRTLKKGLRKL
ncbi:hypothetical protein F5H01DRAFT_351591, partial [Linnemannia elongata]